MQEFDPNTLLDSMETALLVLSNEYKCLCMNEAAEQILCTGRGRAIGLPISTLLPANEEVAKQCEQVAYEQLKLVVRDGVLHFPQWRRSTQVDYTISPMTLNSEGGVLASKGILVEIHEVERRARALEDIHRAEQFDSAILIVKGLSHEIKNPLAGIRGAAQLLQRSSGNGGGEITEFTDVIVSEVDRLATLLDRMSTMNKTPNPKRVDCHEVIDRCVHLTESEFGDSLEFELDFDTSLPKIEADSGQLIQVLLNIFKNAGQAMKGVGCLRVFTRIAYPDASRLSMPQQGVQIIIEDEGPGMTEDMKSRAFLPLVTDKSDGTGLGLAIAQEIIHSHGGFIRIDQAEYGARFSVFLPISN